jgi:hypothetical protein
MNNEQANSPIGLASRKIGFALVEQVAGKDWRDRDVTAIQEAFCEFGFAVVKSVERTMKVDSSE